jgi:hypothetical protein
MFITALTKLRYSSLTLSQINPSHASRRIHYRKILILSFRLRQSLSSRFLLSSISTKTTLLSLSATCPGHLILLDLINIL